MLFHSDILVIHLTNKLNKLIFKEDVQDIIEMGL